MSDAKHTCPACRGAKGGLAHMNTGPDSSKHRWGHMDCLTCGGAGEVSAEHMKFIEDGAQVRKERMERGETLYEASRRLGMSSAELSGLETGRLVSFQKRHAIQEPSNAGPSPRA